MTGRFLAATLPDGTYVAHVSADGVTSFQPARRRTGYYVAVCEYPGSPYALAPDDAPYIGVWTDPHTGVCYVDSTVWVADLATALAIGRACHQLAIWDIAHSCEVWLERPAVVA